MRRFRLLVGGVFILAGCSDASVGNFVDRQTCALDDDCDTGWSCDNQQCAKLCNGVYDCPAADQDCEDGICVVVANASCHASSDCSPPGECQDSESPGECVGGVCVYESLPAGTSCSDGDACTVSDVCSTDSTCAGAAMLCTDPPADRCDGDDFVVYPREGSCEAATGQCVYQPETSPCGPDCAGTCLARCDGVVCATFNGGCRGNGVCVPSDPPTCSYDTALDGARCDRPGEPLGSQHGYCLDGGCSECSATSECVDLPTAYDVCFAPSCDAGVCNYRVNVGVECAAQVCSDNYQVASRTCDSGGDCPVAIGTSCAGYACAGDVCGGGPCVNDSGCAASFYCDQGSCSACEVSESVCDDDLDNDCDGLTDCDDGHCSAAPGCTCTATETPETSCDDGVDNDCDAIPDCDDPHCDGRTCAPGRVCNNQSCLKPDGEACDSGNECGSGECVDDVCCASACAGSCEYCSASGACTPRPLGSTEECGTCQACDAAGGSCTVVTAPDGKNCDAECTMCAAGQCTDRDSDDNSECGACKRCSGNGGNCANVTAPDGNACAGDCTSCDGGACVNRVPGATAECGACNACDTPGGTCVGITANGGKDCVGDCTSCDGGACVDRVAGATAECGACDACGTPGGTCVGLTADGGKDCNAECTMCVAGQCTDRGSDDNTECGACERCTGSGGSCANVTAVDGNSCTGDCTSCDGGACVNRVAGATSECGACEACDAPGGTCAGLTANGGKDCNAECTWCSGGSCINRGSDDNTECGACERCTGSGGSCANVTALDGKGCNGDCTSCDGGACVNRLAGATLECDACEACGTPGGTCVGLTADGGKDCNAECTMCAAGQCTDRNSDDNTECGTCERCAGSGGSCANVTAVDGNSCTGDCTSCDGGACVDRVAGATSECGTCKACDAPGGTCAGLTANGGKNCVGDCTWCSGGSCIDRPVGATQECDAATCQFCTSAGGVCGGTDGCVVECSGFAGGTHASTRESQGAIVLDGFDSGTFTSDLCDGLVPTQWDSLVPAPDAPYGKDLGSGSESGYPSGNADMSSAVGVWGMNGAVGSVSNGSTVADSSVNGTDGTTANGNGSGMALVTGQLGQALSLDGVDDYVVIPSGPGMTSMDQLTFSMWVRPAYAGSPSDYARLLVFGHTNDTDGDTFVVSHYPSASLDFVVYHDSSSGDEALFDVPWSVQAGRWYHLAGTYDGSELSLYVDGVMSESPVATSGALESRTGPLYVGQGFTGMTPPRYCFAGAVDEFALWRRALSTAEVSALYDRGILNLRFQVRSCDVPCTSEPFVGPDGTAATYYSERTNSTTEVPSYSLNVPARRYFQWRAYFDGVAGTRTPRLNDVVVSGSPP